MYSKAIKVRDKHINIVFICCYIQWILFPTRLNLVSAGKCDVSLPLYKQEVTLIQAWISNYIQKKCGMKLLSFPKLQPLKFENKQVILLHTLLGMWLLILAGYLMSVNGTLGNDSIMEEVLIIMTMMWW